MRLMSGSAFFIAAILLQGTTAHAQVFFLQPAWVPAPVFIAPPPFTAPSPVVSRYSPVIPAPLRMVVATPPNVRIERYYFVPSPANEIIPPPSYSAPPAKQAVAPAVAGVIIREYFVMDHPVQLRQETKPADPNSKDSTPEQTKPEGSEPEKLKAPPWSGKFDLQDKTEPIEPVTPPPTEAKEATADEKPTPPAETPAPTEEEPEKPGSPTDPIPPAEPPASTGTPT